MFSSATEAETAFYDAFRLGNHERMMAVWSSSEDIYCIHPMGPRLIGRRLVALSWQQILANSALSEFDITLNSSWNDGAVAVHFVDEKISVPGSSQQFKPVYATNIYRRVDDGWLMTAHHASVDVSNISSGQQGAPNATRH